MLAARFLSAGPQLIDRKRNRSRQHTGHTGRITSNRLRGEEGIVEEEKILPPDRLRLD